VSSPGPPSSEASERKHSGEEDEEEEEEEDEDEADDGCSDNLSYMDRVVMEVVESEAVYVRDVQQVVEVTSNAICSLVFIRIVTRFHHIHLWKKENKRKAFFFFDFTPCISNSRRNNTLKGGWVDMAIRPEVRNVTLHGTAPLT
jgi:hypothetical protein